MVANDEVVQAERADSLKSFTPGAIADREACDDCGDAENDAQAAQEVVLRRYRRQDWVIKVRSSISSTAVGKEPKDITAAI